MIRVTGTYLNQRVELDQPLVLANGTAVEIEVRTIGTSPDPERDEWAEIAVSRLEETWDNSGDAIYDNWKKLYGV